MIECMLATLVSVASGKGHDAQKGVRKLDMFFCINDQPHNDSE